MRFEALKQPPPFWWVGLSVECHSCHGSILFEAEDVIEQRYHSAKYGWLGYFNCPNCKVENTVAFRRPLQ